MHFLKTITEVNGIEPNTLDTRIMLEKPDRSDRYLGKKFHPKFPLTFMEEGSIFNDLAYVADIFEGDLGTQIPLKVNGSSMPNSHRLL